jgi:catechol 2,3-dioxygenase-like lactoylglutathione lyase family enzyme
MACRITELVLDCRNPEVLADFWCQVLGFVVLQTEEDGSIEIGPDGTDPDNPGLTLVLSPSTDQKRAKLPLHFDVNAVDGSQDEELQRLFRLGARTADVGQTGEESWHVLADPEGNQFCLLRRTVRPASLPAAAARDRPWLRR